MPTRVATPTQFQRPSALPRPTPPTYQKGDGPRPPLPTGGSLNSIQATALANATAAATGSSRIPMVRRLAQDAAAPRESSATNADRPNASSDAASKSTANSGNGSNNGRITSTKGSGMVPKSPLTVVEEEERSGPASDDSYDDDEVLAVTGGVAGVRKMRQTATQTLAEFLRTTGPQDYHLAAARPPSRAQTPVKKRRSLFFRRKKKPPVRSASPAPGLIRQVVAAASAADGSGYLVPPSSANPVVARAMSPVQRSASWRLRRKFVALMPGLPGQPQLRTRPPSALRNRVAQADTGASAAINSAGGTDRDVAEQSAPGQSVMPEPLSPEAIAANNAARNALLPVPTPLSPPPGEGGSQPVSPLSPTEEPLSPVGKSLSSFQSEFSAALAAFLQRPDGNGATASSRIATFHSVYGDIQVDKALRRKRKVQFSRTDDLIDEREKVTSKAAAEEAEEHDSSVDDDDVSDDVSDDSDAESAVNVSAPNAPRRRLNSTGTQATLTGLCMACESKLRQPHALPSDVFSDDDEDGLELAHRFGRDDDDDEDDDDHGGRLRSRASMEELFSQARQSRRSVRHVQVQTSASFFPPPLAMAADALAPVPPPETSTMGTQCDFSGSTGRKEAGDVRPDANGSDNLDFDLDSNSVHSAESGSGDGAVNEILMQQTGLREQLQDAQECLRNERRERERLETAMTQARAKFDGVSAQAYKAIRSLMEERRVLMEETRRLRRLASDLVAAAAAAEAANSQHRRPRSAAGRRVYQRGTADRTSYIDSQGNGDDEDDEYADCDDVVTEDELNGDNPLVEAR
ncbi:hypothetical protein THASP1DRAFT_30421 [Thamnocephalis sphaerospora]|uniref:Uncharacterized protein n=1 Tax=Thamnocephalis sphaerospora TaxID=78915 RepID=A0A4P9XP63_9FUNG|nr:hypothetical protein THASP1DRAFT_30421 [Thamnocephalis sphaerospora]|eukprot:RKP07766.1 hypothetical protein THASP1DRAFT_30421 [Thamnocephalis sphaerospora]